MGLTDFSCSFLLPFLFTPMFLSLEPVSFNNFLGIPLLPRLLFLLCIFTFYCGEWDSIAKIQFNVPDSSMCETGAVEKYLRYGCLIQPPYLRCGESIRGHMAPMGRTCHSWPSCNEFSSAPANDPLRSEGHVNWGSKDIRCGEVSYNFRAAS